MRIETKDRVFPHWTSAGNTRTGCLKVWVTLSLSTTQQEAMRIDLGVQANMSERVNQQTKAETTDYPMVYALCSWCILGSS